MQTREVPQSASASDNTAVAGYPEGTAGRAAAEGPVDPLRFSLLRSALYHEARAGWFDALNRWSLFVTLILGSGAIAGFSGDLPLLGKAAGLAVALVSGASLVWEFSGRARDHAELRGRFYALLADLDGGAARGHVAARLPLIYAGEPPVRFAVNALAHNQAGRSLAGDNFIKVRVTFWQRRARHVLAFAPADFPDLT